ncbi:MAG: glycosyltransferase family 4 protein [Methylomicrobium sp.]|nr:glycosyltransferase family 4 protein [Methylomicrobium sp.]
MKVTHLNCSDISGGAARAAYRIHHALRQQGIDSHMCVANAQAGDWTVTGPQSKWSKALSKLRPLLGALCSKSLSSGNSTFNSLAILPSNRSKNLNASDSDVIHLHWVNDEMMSIADIARLNKPIVWTLHDMWAFSGAEHYPEHQRWQAGYTKENRPDSERGLDVNRWVWQRKRKHWQRPFHIVTPSHWLADCVRKSVLMGDWPLTVIPNAIDTQKWSPVDKALARQLLHLPEDVPLLLFGAIGGVSDFRKGFDLLQASLLHLQGLMPDLELLVLGQLAPKKPQGFGFPMHYTGHLHDDVSLRLFYSAADAIVVPSRQDNLPNAGVESLACGTPVIAFDTCGLPDIVRHKHSGYLARAFDIEDLALGIQWVMQDEKRTDELSQNARADAVARFSYSIVADQYSRLYQSLVSSV